MSKSTLIDLTGQKFDNLIVLGRSEDSLGKNVRWLCQCDCGKNIVRFGSILRGSVKNGKFQSCGCHRYKDLVNQKFGKLTVLERINENRKNGTLWKCECECGNIKEVSTQHLEDGGTVSCGCHKKHKNISNQYGRKYGLEESIWVRLYQDYKRKAPARGYVFELSMKEFQEIAGQDCKYCGEKPKKMKRSATKLNQEVYVLANGIDRSDNTKGYVLNNCVPCCKICNQMKMDLSLEVFKDKVLKIAKKIN